MLAEHLSLRRITLRKRDFDFRQNATQLSPEDLREIDAATAKITVQGARYPERLERITGL